MDKDNDDNLLCSEGTDCRYCDSGEWCGSANSKVARKLMSDMEGWTMGEIADSMLAGEVCELCGVWNPAVVFEVGGELQFRPENAPGIPWHCEACLADEQAEKGDN